MWKRHLWIRIVHVSSFILLKTQYFFKSNYKKVYKAKSALKTSINMGCCDFAVTRNERQDGAILG